MSFNFTVKEFILGNGNGTPTLQFYKRGFVLGGGGESPSWQDIILSGTTALTLVNAKANGLNYLKLFGGTEQLPETYLDTVTLSGGCEQNGTPTPDTHVDIICNNGALKVNRNLYSTEYHNEPLSQTNGVTTISSVGVNVSAMVDCRTIKSFKITTVSPQGSFRIFKYGTDNTFVNATSTANIGDIVTVEDSVGFFRIQYNYTSFGTNTENILIYNSAYDLNEVYADGTQEVVTDSAGNTASAEMLCAVGSYKDTQEVIGGTVTKNTGILVLKGTESWNSTIVTNCYALNGVVGTGLMTNRRVICTHFGSADSLPSADARQGLALIGNQTNDYTVAFGATTQFPTPTAWNNWLAEQYNAGTPVIVVFPKSTSTTSSVSGQILSKSPVTQTAGAISNLGIAETSSSHTTPTPTQPLQINCNNGVVKAFYGNKFTTDGATAGYLISVSTGELSPNSNYSVTDYIYLRAGNYTGTFSDNGSGARYFRCWSYNIDNDTPIESIFNIQAAASLVTFSFSIDENSYTRVSYRNSFSQMTISPTSPIIHTDGITEKVELHSLNLFDVGALTRNAGYMVFTVNGSFTDSDQYTRSDYIPVLPSTQYIRTTSGAASTVFFDINKNFLSSRAVTSFTTPADCYYVMYNIKNSVDYSQGMMVKGGELPATYSPYFNGGQATAEMLLKVGEYQDVQSIIDGGVTRNVGVLVLDGTEDWWQSDTKSDVYRLVLTDAKREQQAILSTHFIGTNAADVNMPSNSIKVGSYAAVPSYGVIGIRLTDVTTLADFKAYLADQYNAGTPVIVVYPTSSPTTETVTGQPMSIQAGTNVVEITQASMDNLELEVSYKAGVEVTITEVENAQLDNNVEVTIQ